MFLLFLYWCTWLDVIFKKSIFFVIQYFDPNLPISAGGHQLEKPSFFHLEMLDRNCRKIEQFFTLRYRRIYV